MAAREPEKGDYSGTSLPLKRSGQNSISRCPGSGEARDQAALRRLLRYCACPLPWNGWSGQLTPSPWSAATPKPSLDGHTELGLTPLGLLDLLAALILPPRVHRHRAVPHI